MGLDYVEFVMTLEEQFGIVVTDDAAATLRTAGDLHRYVVGQLARREADPCRSARLFHRFRRTVMAKLSVSREAVRPATPLAGLLPKSARRSIWAAASGPGPRLPSLRFPRRLRTALWVLALAAPGAGLAALAAGAPQLFCGAPVAWLLIVVLAAWLVRPLATEFPSGCVVVADVIRWVSPNPYRVVDEGRPREWTEDDVWRRVQAILAHVLGLAPEQIRPEYDLVRDLGMG